MNGQIEEGTDTGALPANRKTATHNPPKTVAFPLILSKTHQSQARLPLRVNVRPHDTTESIISTVKNFYGLYEGNGVAFEDDSGITIIPRYENVSPNDTIHVRITKEVSPDESQPPSLWPSRPASRAHSRSPSRRRGSANIWPCQPSADQQDDRDAVNGYSDSDGGSVSGAGSRRAKSDNVASAEISVDNILEGNRRKKAKFESSVSLKQIAMYQDHSFQVSVALYCKLELTYPKGTTALHPSSNACDSFNIIHVASETTASK